VRKAYLAANRGRFADANRLVTPKAVASDWEARRKLAEVLGRRLLRSDRYRTWKGLTRGCSIRELVVREERVRGRYATVAFTLTLNGGRSVRETERLVRKGHRWLIG